jgi:cytidylate kinase
MSPECPICGRETKKERSIHGGRIIEDYVCEDCSIAWYLDSDLKWRIRVSSTHSIASKLNDEGFQRLLKKIEKYEKGL